MAKAPVELGGGGSAGPYADLETLPAQVRVEDALGQRRRHHFGIACAGEATHTDVHARRNQGRGLVGRHDLAAQLRVEDTVVHAHGPGKEEGRPGDSTPQDMSFI